MWTLNITVPAKQPAGLFSASPSQWPGCPASPFPDPCIHYQSTPALSLRLAPIPVTPEKQRDPFCHLRMSLAESTALRSGSRHPLTKAGIFRPGPPKGSCKQELEVLAKLGEALGGQGKFFVGFCSPPNPARALPASVGHRVPLFSWLPASLSRGDFDHYRSWKFHSAGTDPGIWKVQGGLARPLGGTCLQGPAGGQSPVSALLPLTSWKNLAIPSLKGRGPAESLGGSRSQPHRPCKTPALEPAPPGALSLCWGLLEHPVSVSWVAVTSQWARWGGGMGQGRGVGSPELGLGRGQGTALLSASVPFSGELEPVNSRGPSSLRVFYLGLEEHSRLLKGRGRVGGGGSACRACQSLRQG